MEKCCKLREAKVACRLSIALLLLVGIFFLGKPVRADGSAVPGRAVGHVFLGMDRADVWKILGKPGHTAAVPHGMNLYGEDIWTGNGHALTVVSERDKVIQVEFDSPRITTTSGLSPRSTLAQVRRHYPSLMVRTYTLVPFVDTGDHIIYGTDAFYLDSIRGGIAFVFTDQEGIMTDSLNDSLNKIIVHRPGYPVVPIYENHWPRPATADDDPNGLRRMRSWFTSQGTKR